MELRQLRYFVASAELKNIARAAATLHVSQPPVSRQIRALEHELGLELFIRTPRGVELTPAGAKFLIDARRILSDVEAAKKNAQATDRGELGTLNIAFFGSCIYNALPLALHALKDALPGVEVTIQRVKKAQQIENLLRGSTDIGFGRYYGLTSDLIVETLAQEPFYVAVSAREALHIGPSFSVADVVTRPLIMFPSAGRPNFADHVLTVLAELGHSPHVAAIAEDASTALAQVAHGDTRCLVPATVASLRFPGIKFFPLSGCDALVPVNCIYRKKNIIPVLQAFLSILRQVEFEAHWYTDTE